MRCRGSPRHCSTPQTCGAPAVLRDISEGTSYQAVRLVFRPYAQVLPSNCTSERLRASTGVSPGFAQPRRSSLPIGSHARSSCHVACQPSLRPAVPDSLRTCTPWSVLQDGANQLAPPVVSRFRRPSGLLVAVPSRYLSAIGPPPYLAFDGRHHRFALHDQAALLAPRRAAYGACTLCGRLSPAFALRSHNSACRLPCGLLPVRSPLLQESPLVSSPPPSDMLKSGGLSAAPPLSDTGSRV